MATLVSVNVGMPRDVDWNGRVVHTGAWKAPVAGATMVRRTNLDGDGQGDLGGHGGEIRAVLVYQLDSYRHWARELGRDDLAPGAFGENLTVDGLPDDEVCIGDRYRIGGAVLEVTQPRVTCYRVGLRLDEPRMAALLVGHHRPGFYCRVIEEGAVEAGLEIVKVADGPERITVAEIDALLYLPGHPQERLKNALRIPALSPGWRTSLQSLRDQDGDTASTGNSGLIAAANPPAWQGFRSLRVVEVHRESPTVTSFSLAGDDADALPAADAGQAIAVRLAIPGAIPVVRNYSLSNAPGGNSYRISVKRERFGVASAFLHDNVSVGDVLEIAAPRGTFTLDGNTGPIILVSAGVGITPVLAMLHRLVQTGSTREVWWLHSARSEQERPFADEVTKLLSRLPGNRSEIFYARDGRLNEEKLRTLAPPLDADAYLCGPTSFMADIGSALAAYGLASNRIHTETFGTQPGINPGVLGSVVTPPHQPPGPPGSGPEVQFSRAGVSAPWSAEYSSLLEFAEACDVPTRWSCRTGVCHTCETPILAGAVSYPYEPLEPAAEGNALLCIATPSEPVVFDL
ncbi:MOSC domain-containing protein [Mycobacterium sp. 236(2023)]|uniref:MOSC domain-containing protein n=1 Tax=Mycobacterium sp. 236(2023) TaxID=3038163 RepID=UPI0024158DD4|nr:MOSC domain-containing protein [Mycobacterium sp. 236(2023)]MDG4667034.1 MOSC domain-containing protein [Mycobacterium sp. 236(2023)]